MADPIVALPDGDEDLDSSYGENLGSSTSSLTSSIYAYTSENGRTYHAYEAGKYMMPNDADEQERMDIHYHAIRILLENKPFYAPIGPNPQLIIDQGTGTGIWCMDVGDMFPSAKVIGTDLSPIQPRWVPPNVEFRIDDFEKPWLYDDNHFDLVHNRVTSGIAVKDWPKYLAEAYRTLKPGGWMEAQEFMNFPSCDDGSLPKDSASVKWHDLFNEGALMAGINTRISAETIEAHFKDAGLINVVVKKFKLPIGPWAKDKRLREAGLLALGGLLDGVSGLSMAIFTRLLKWTPDELEALLIKVRAEWRNKSIHQYWLVYVIYGQKPEAIDADKSSP